jgi:membrane fusion protein, multidrug efflux system
MIRSLVLALVITVLAAAWMLTGSVTRSGDTAPALPAAEPAEAKPMPVRTSILRAEPFTPFIAVTGRTEANRKIEIRAETDGRVVEVTTPKGSHVKAGTIIARLAIEERVARLAEATALNAQRALEFEAASELARKNFRSDTQVATAKAQYDAAKAMVERMKVDLERTNIRVPFTGILDRRDVEIGSYLRAGDHIATLIDIDPVLAVAHLVERDAITVRPGARGRVRLVDGTAVEGTIRFVAAAADERTRTFRVELELANPDFRTRDGTTAEVILPQPAIMAHRISSALLSLGDDGRIGIKTVEAGIVRFVPVKIVGSGAAGTWVTGMPAEAQVILVGHEFVSAGQKVSTQALSGASQP